MAGKLVEDWDHSVAIIATVYIAVAYLLVYDKPAFPPTMSEEDKSHF